MQPITIFAILVTRTFHPPQDPPKSLFLQIKYIKYD